MRRFLRSAPGPAATRRAARRQARVAASAWERVQAALRFGGNAQEPLQFFAVTLGTFDFVIAKDERFKVVLAFSAGVFKQRHGLTPAWITGEGESSHRSHLRYVF